ncbi:MAG: MFS transporter [Candidatus Pacebacteria bacterium]|nr:MFS transporter [Candidatus Paceibacterota bacterium]
MSSKKSFSGAMIVLIFVMLINALSYGTIIPLLYPYSARFGLNPAGLGFLFASYSLFQFLATPLIGRLSDKYGRRPLLILSLVGTSISLALFASATSLMMLFFARMLDGITGGNISVAQAVIADTQKPKERAKWFAFLGAAFGFGFLVGPAIGGLLSQYGLAVPFWFASAVSAIGAILAIFLLPETKSPNTKVSLEKEKLIDLPKLWNALKAPTTGALLAITFIASTGRHAFIIGFQSTTVDVLKFTPTQVGLIFTAFGLANVLMQSIGVKFLLKRFSSRVLLKYSLLIGLILVSLLGFAVYPIPFLIIIGFYMFVPPNLPFISGMISVATKEEDQGGILGLSQAYTSLGQIVGPILAGLITSFYIPGAFWLAAIIWFGAFYMVTRIPKVSKKINL